MRAVIQRVKSASVTIDDELTTAIGPGLVVLVGAEQADREEDTVWLAGKIVGLRLFPDDSGSMARSVTEIGGEILIVSQFTLFASTKKGTRPSWHRAAKADLARELYRLFVAKVANLLGGPVQTGRFGAMMQIALVNDGPVTLIVDTKHRE